MATSYYDSFIKKLEEVFMMDHAELDFGIYRIMNQKRNDIKQFLEKDLLPQVKKILAENAGGASDADKSRLATLQQQLGSDIDSLPETIPMVREYKQLKAKLEQSADTEALENEVYSHLTTFFGRYYDGGDFISKRRYKDNTYAIPYNGEEVKLHWANCDQYYIKTSEYFQNYTFKTPDGKMVHFVLKDASTEQNNNKSQNNMERRFALYAEEGQTSVEVVDGELNIYFTYELMPKATKQKDLNAQALETLKGLIPDNCTVLLSQISASDTRSLLEKHITDYTAKNSFDYFIHKDLGGFLRRELDFYIKNEVMHIDDLDVNHINAQLAKVKAIKGVGDKIIRFLANLEDFQKKLWLKKKFIVQTDYCITLDRVPEELYPEICANDAQRKEWVRLFAIDDIQGSGMFEVGYSEPLTVEFLKANPFLVLDTAFFAEGFKHRLLAKMEDLEKDLDGLLINSENFQAIRILNEQYKNNINCIYIDPPYNAKSSEILYKNTFKHASWLSLMENRLAISNVLLAKDGVEVVAIDEIEQCKLTQLLSDMNPEKEVAPVAVVHNPTGQQGYNISFSSEYAIFVYPVFNNKNTLGLEERTNPDEWDTRTFRDNSGNSNLRTDAKNCFYPIYVKNNTIIGIGDVCDDSFHPASRNVREGDVIAIYPIDNNSVEKKWVFERGTVESIKDELWIKEISPCEIDIMRTKKKFRFKSCWFDKKYSANSYGSRLLTAMRIPFDYPKSIHTVTDCIIAGLGDRKDGIVLDFFAGSGTTAHSAIALNRKDSGKRKYILVEVGSYFDNATRTRVEKAIYSEDWNNGKPVSRCGVSQCFKYVRLEQYEDTLNNLIVKEADNVFSSKDNNAFKESYMLGYMLDTETKGSLFNLEWFVNPFAMTLKTTKNNELLETKVDMVETFNFLIGLNVETIHWHQDDAICVVEGTTHRDNEKTLVIWRDCTRVDNDQLNRFFEKMDYSTLAHDFDVIYVNGDNKLPNLRRDNDRWKVVLIEEEFQKRMFEED